MKTIRNYASFGDEYLAMQAREKAERLERATKLVDQYFNPYWCPEGDVECVAEKTRQRTLDYAAQDAARIEAEHRAWAAQVARAQYEKALRDKRNRSFFRKVTDAVSDVVTSIGKLPVIEIAVAQAEIITAPYQVAARIAQGERIDRAVVSELRDSAKAFQTQLKYAQVVVSLVPGVGPPISGAIAGAGALASGQPWDEALLTAAKNSLPGGPVTAAAITLAEGLARGERAESILARALPIAEPAKSIVTSSARVIGSALRGESVDDDLLVGALSLLPVASQAIVENAKKLGPLATADALIGEVEKQVTGFAKPLQTILATSGARSLQTAVATAVGDVQNLVALRDAGLGVLSADRILGGLAGQLPAPVRQGMAVGTTLVSGADIPLVALSAARDGLDSGAQAGYTTALCAIEGRAVARRAQGSLGQAIRMLQSTLPAPQLAGVYVALGSTAAPPAWRENAVKALSESPARQGLIQGLQLARATVPWWRAVLNWIQGI